MNLYIYLFWVNLNYFAWKNHFKNWYTHDLYLSDMDGAHFNGILKCLSLSSRFPSVSPPWLVLRQVAFFTLLLITIYNFKNQIYIFICPSFLLLHWSIFIFEPFLIFQNVEFDPFIEERAFWRNRFTFISILMHKIKHTKSTLHVFYFKSKNVSSRYRRYMNRVSVRYTILCKMNDVIYEV